MESHQKQFTKEIIIPSYASNLQHNNQEQQNNYYFHGHELQEIIKDKAITIWRGRNEKNILIISLVFLFLFSILIHWIFAATFCIFSSLLAIYEIIPKLPKFQNNKKKIKEFLITIFIGIAWIAIMINTIAWGNIFFRKLFSIISGQAIGLTISLIVIKKMKQLAKQKRLLDKSEGNQADANLLANNNSNDDELGIETQFYNLEDNVKMYCIIGFIFSILMLWIIGMIAKLEILQFIFYTLLIMTVYEGTERIPFLSQFIPNKKALLLILFGSIGTHFLIIGSISFSFTGISATCLACAVSIYFFKRWKKLFQIEDNKFSKDNEKQQEISVQISFEQGNKTNLSYTDDNAAPVEIVSEENLSDLKNDQINEAK